MIFTQEIMIINMLLTMFLFLLTGYPVAFTIAGVPLLFAFFGQLTGIFDMSYVAALPNRIYGIMTNDLLISVPLFVFMGVMLQKSKIAEELLESMAILMSNVRSGLTISVTLVGALLAASTGIVGATVVTMGLLSLPTINIESLYSSRITNHLREYNCHYKSERSYSLVGRASC